MSRTLDHSSDLTFKYTQSASDEFRERATGLEYAKPITIGEDVWIGGSAVICPGVIVCDHCVIGAGNVITKDIPSDVFCHWKYLRVIRVLDR
jgi:maltose O-acetyltransferase